MGFEIGQAQPSVHRALADLADEAPLHGGVSQRPDRPMRADAPQLGPGTTRHRKQVMALFGGKSGQDAPGVEYRSTHSAGAEQTALATSEPSAGFVPPCGRWPDSRAPGPLITRPGPEWRATSRCALHDTDGAVHGVRHESVESVFRVPPISVSFEFSVVSPCPPGYLIQGGSRI